MTMPAAIRHQIMWNRLIAIVEEQARTLVRAAFSPAVREGGDLSAGVFDTKGQMLAQAVTGTPGHVNCMATAVRHFLDRHPVISLKEDDVLITNDPWLASGHLHDVTIVSPAFLEGRCVGLFAATVHIVDVGGRGMGPDGRSIFEEGIRIPIMPLSRAGTLNEDLLTILLANSREPEQVQGDILAIVAAGREGGQRLVEMLVEFGSDELETLAAFIINRSRNATLKAIARLKPGIYQNEMKIDGYDYEVRLVATLTVTREGLALDYTGTSKASSYGINVVGTYTTAYSLFGLKCASAPGIPNDAGSMSCFTVTAPDGSILNARDPAPVSARHIIGHALPDVVMGCMEQCLPGGTAAESGMMWNPYARGIHLADKRPWEVFLFNSGGMGARPDKDGLSATAFPSGIKNIPIEAIEAVVPVLFHRKELRPDSGGAGTWRGGLGQVVEIASSEPASEIAFQAMFDRVDNPARGRSGGSPGAPGRVTLDDGTVLKAKGLQRIPPGRKLILELPGGAGFGPASERDPARLARDLEEGYVTLEGVRRDYKST